ncbi:MAG: hypothetical protein R3F31_19070 [Verrucomicrobiales bacterium]
MTTVTPSIAARSRRNSDGRPIASPPALKRTVDWYFNSNAWINGIREGTYQGQRLGQL